MREHEQVELIRLQRRCWRLLFIWSRTTREALVMSRPRFAVRVAGEIGQLDEPETLISRPNFAVVAELSAD